LEMGVTNIGYDLIFDWRVQYTDNKAGGYWEIGYTCSGVCLDWSVWGES
jgi:hypothetical protein